MKAIVFKKYGPPEKLVFSDIKKPEPGDNEVLIKVNAASVNALDWHIMRASPFIARLSTGLFSPKVKSLGADVSGVIEAKGKKVEKFNLNDEVFGDTGIKNLGSFAEYVVVNQYDIIRKPKNIDHLKTAGIPVASLTALQGLRDAGKIKEGDKVLINGASGGVGSMAVQIAKSFNTHVTGVSSAKNHELVYKLGADKMLDYNSVDFTNTSEKYDLIFDAVGNRTMADLKRALKPEGRCSIAGFTSMKLMLQHAIRGNLNSKKAVKKLGLMKTASMNEKDLLFIRDLMEAEKLYTTIDKIYRLEEVPLAIKYLETGRAAGKVIIQIKN